MRRFRFIASTFVTSLAVTSLAQAAISGATEYVNQFTSTAATGQSSSTQLVDDFVTQQYRIQIDGAGTSTVTLNTVVTPTVGTIIAQQGVNPTMDANMPWALKFGSTTVASGLGTKDRNIYAVTTLNFLTAATSPTLQATRSAYNGQTPTTYWDMNEMVAIPAALAPIATTVSSSGNEGTHWLGSPAGGYWDVTVGANAINDGIAGSVWGTDDGTAVDPFVILDLGGIKTVDALAIQLGSNQNPGLLAPTAFTIEKRNLDLSWTTIVTGSGFNGSADVNRLLALDLSTSAVTDQLRITLPGASASWRTIGEVMVFNELPEPSSLGILSLGALMLARRRR